MCFGLVQLVGGPAAPGGPGPVIIGHGDNSPVADRHGQQAHHQQEQSEQCDHEDAQSTHEEVVRQ